jgi:hypothetical protein
MATMLAVLAGLAVISSLSASATLVSAEHEPTVRARGSHRLRDIRACATTRGSLQRESVVTLRDCPSSGLASPHILVLRVQMRGHEMAL